jgi:hypothetical protein
MRKSVAALTGMAAVVLALLTVVGGGLALSPNAYACPEGTIATPTAAHPDMCSYGSPSPGIYPQYSNATWQYVACVEKRGYKPDADIELGWTDIALGWGAANDIARGTPPSVEATRLYSNYDATWGEVTAITDCAASVWPNGHPDGSG